MVAFTPINKTGLDVGNRCVGLGAVGAGGAAVQDGEGAGGGPGEQHHGGPGHHHLKGLRPAGPVPPAVPPQPRQEQGQATPVRTQPHSLMSNVDHVFPDPLVPS